MTNQKCIVFFNVEQDKFFRYTAYLIDNNLIARGLEGYNGTSPNDIGFWKKEKIGYVEYEKEMKKGQKISLFDKNNSPILQLEENFCENNQKIRRFALEGIIQDIHLIR